MSSIPKEKKKRTNPFIPKKWLLPKLSPQKTQELIEQPKLIEVNIVDLEVFFPLLFRNPSVNTAG